LSIHYLYQSWPTTIMGYQYLWTFIYHNCGSPTKPFLWIKYKTPLPLMFIFYSKHYQYQSWPIGIIEYYILWPFLTMIMGQPHKALLFIGSYSKKSSHEGTWHDEYHFFLTEESWSEWKVVSTHGMYPWYSNSRRHLEYHKWWASPCERTSVSSKM